MLRLLVRDGAPTKLAFGVVISIWLTVIAFWVGVICIGIHFVHKYW